MWNVKKKLPRCFLNSVTAPSIHIAGCGFRSIINLPFWNWFVLLLVKYFTHTEEWIKHMYSLKNNYKASIVNHSDQVEICYYCFLSTVRTESPPPDATSTNEIDHKFLLITIDFIFSIVCPLKILVSFCLWNVHKWIIKYFYLWLLFSFNGIFVRFIYIDGYIYSLCIFMDVWYNINI